MKGGQIILKKRYRRKKEECFCFDKHANQKMRLKQMFVDVFYPYSLFQTSIESILLDIPG